jgi:uncharacterized membrane protein
MSDKVLCCVVRFPLWSGLKMIVLGGIGVKSSFYLDVCNRTST